MMTQSLPERSRIKLHTDLVLELVDSFTQQLIQQNRLAFIVDGVRKRPTKNKNGMVIFCNLYVAPHIIEISGGVYQKYVLRLSEAEMAQMASGNYVHRLVRLNPSRLYPVPKWATVIEGQIEVAAGKDMDIESLELQAVVDQRLDVYRVKTDLEKDAPLMIHQTKQEVLLGRRFYDVEMGIQSSFVLKNKNGEGYDIEPSPSSKLEAHAKLTEVTSVQIEHSGAFLFVFGKIEAGTASVKLYIKQMKIGEIQFETGAWNQIGAIQYSK